MSTHALNPPLDIALGRPHAARTSEVHVGVLRRLGTFAEDAAILLAIALSLPFVIIALALPVILVVQVVSWIARLM